VRAVDIGGAGYVAHAGGNGGADCDAPDDAGSFAPRDNGDGAGSDYDARGGADSVACDDASDWRLTTTRP
jgi:hypothetical protein